MNSRFILLLSAIALFISCNAPVTVKQTSSVSKEIRVQTITVSPSTLSNERSYIGVVEESNSVLLSFTTPGRISKVNVTEGQYVKQGQVLAEIDSTTLTQMHATTLATLRQAEDGFARIQQLYASNSIPEVQYIDIKTKLEQARAAERIAAKSLEETKLLAPQNGVIGKKMMEVGLNALPDQPVASLLNTQALVIKVAIPENEIYDTRVGQRAHAQIRALNGASFEGSVMEKAVKAHPIAHSYDVKIALHGATQHVMPGMVCQVSIQNRAQDPGMVVPNKAVQPMEFGKGYYVWTVDAEDVVHRRVVTLGDLAPDGIVITDGLATGDRVVVAGYQQVSENCKVTVVHE